MGCLRTVLLTLLLVPVVGYVILCAAIYFQQDDLLFHPSPVSEEKLSALARSDGFVPWLNARGERIGWRSVTGDPKNALLIFHGNGNYALDKNYHRLRAPIDPATFQFYLLEYPGYGLRPGPPSTRRFVEAALETVDQLATDPSPAGDRPPRRIWLLGQSMGTGVACAVAAARPDRISGVVLVTPYNSLAAGAAFHYPWLPARLLLHHRLDSDQNLARYHGPVAFLLAGRDGTIPPQLGRALYDGYAGPKRLWLAPDAGHNDLEALLAPWPELLAWLNAPR